MSYSKTVAERLVTDIDALSLSAGDDVSVAKCERFDRTKRTTLRLPHVLVRNAGLRFDPNGQTWIVRYTVYVELRIKRDRQGARPSDEVEEQFTHEVARVVAAAAKDLRVELELLDGAPFHEIDGDFEDEGARLVARFAWEVDQAFTLTT